MTIATQVLTYIKQNNELITEEVKTTKEETLNIFKELKDELRIFESGCIEHH